LKALIKTELTKQAKVAFNDLFKITDHAIDDVEHPYI